MIKKKVLVLLFISAILYASGGKEIKPDKKISLDIAEPSGLAYSEAEDCFYTVSDEEAAVYKFSRKGKVKEIIEIDGYDLEGVAVDKDGTVFVVDEAYCEVIAIDTEGSEKLRFKLDLNNTENNGPEGICIDSDKRLFYIVNEKNPGIILVYDFEGNKIDQHIPGLASDYSDICYDSVNKQFGILSDEEHTVYLWHPVSGLSAKYKIDVNNPEGIVIKKDGTVFIVSDREESFYIFKQFSRERN